MLLSLGWEFSKSCIIEKTLSRTIITRFSILYSFVEVTKTTI